MMEFRVMNEIDFTNINENADRLILKKSTVL